jgi:cytochrome d ubiquinol oxidase subunit I
MYVAALETGAFVIAGISAYYLLKKTHPAFFLKSFKIALLSLVVIAPLQVWIGDSSGGEVFKDQPAKGAAIEGHWTTNKPGEGAPWALLAWPNQAEQKNDWALELPDMLSVLATHTTTGKVIGLRDIPVADQPPMLPVLFYAFRVMVGIGFWFVFLAFWTAWIWRKTRGKVEPLLAHRKLLWAWVLSIPLPYVAVEMGWTVREVGRQPWIVYGLLRTEQAASALSSFTVGASMAMFAGFYLLLFTSFIVFARRWLRAGPDMTLEPPAEPRRILSVQGGVYGH